MLRRFRTYLSCSEAKWHEARSASLCSRSQQHASRFFPSGSKITQFLALKIRQVRGLPWLLEQEASLEPLHMWAEQLSSKSWLVTSPLGGGESRDKWLRLWASPCQLDSGPLGSFIGQKTFAQLNIRCNPASIKLSLISM